MQVDDEHDHCAEHQENELWPNCVFKEKERDYEDDSTQEVAHDVEDDGLLGHKTSVHSNAFKQSAMLIFESWRRPIFSPSEVVEGQDDWNDDQCQDDRD